MSARVTASNESLTPTVFALVTEAYRTWDHDRNASRASLQRAAELLETAREPELQRDASRTGYGLARWQLLRVQAHIDANLDRKVARSELARLVKLSSAHFSRSFKKRVGKTVCGYVMERKLAAVKVALLTTPETLCQIALRFGFADQAHLSRRFCRETGIPPNRWRREQRSGEVPAAVR